MATTDFTVRDVLEWARTKPADEQYDFTEASDCAVAQFGKATGRPHLVGLPCSEVAALNPQLLAVVTAIGEDATFGALVRRLEKLCPETPFKLTEWARLDAYMADIELAAA